MEIKIGNTILTASDDLDAVGYWKLIQRITRMLAGVSGVTPDSNIMYSLAINLHRFLVENKDFVIGVVNAGKTKTEEK